MDLTYETVQAICNTNEAFKMKHQVINGYEVAQCTYFLASPGDFFDAFKDGSMVRATELRGITFVKENDIWKRYLFIDKFFNINQTNGSDVTYMNLTINGKTIKCNINKLYAADIDHVYRAIDLKKMMIVGEFDRNTENIKETTIIANIHKEILPTEHIENSWMYDDVKDLKIVRIGNKEDGSAIRFLNINGKLMAKTKFSFEAEQTTLAMNVVNSNKNLKRFIESTLENNLVALFEIVSPFNKVVLSYNETSLKLIQLRDETTGKYLDIYNNELVKDFNIVCAEQEPLYTLDELLSMSMTIENKEGWVVTFENGKMAKVKTKWYMDLHGLLTGGLQEHKLIAKIIDEDIDDLLSFIPVENIAERDFINEITHIITSHVNHVTNYVYNTFTKNYSGNRKDFVMKFKQDKYFHFMTRLFKNISYEDLEKVIGNDIKFKCRKLEMAKTFLADLGFKRELNIIEED